MRDQVQQDDTCVLVCYISGLDMRRIEPGTMPFVAGAMQRFPWRRFTNLPSNELFPTMVTGVDPTVHGVWGVRYQTARFRSPWTRLAERLPKIMTTSYQCLKHYLDNTFDLPAVEPARRNSFVMTRTKYKRRHRRPEALFSLGGIPTVFDAVGDTQSYYRYSSSFVPVREVLPVVAEGQWKLEILELYSLDRYQQWHLDDETAVGQFYGQVDDFLSHLEDKCHGRGISLLLLSDHGHEPIRESIDLLAELRHLGLGQRDLSYFIEVSSARFWFHNQAAEVAVNQWLKDLSCGTLISWQDMAQYQVPLADPSYGELFYFLDPGYIFFPHDFYQPLANWFLGVSDPVQRKRLRDPRHRGNHGHLPNFEAEASFMLLFDEGFSASDHDGTVLDVAPTMLAVAGVTPPSHMIGRSLFRRCDR